VEGEKLVRAVEEILAQKDAYRSRFCVFDEDKRNYVGAKTAVDAIEAAIDNQTLKVRGDLA
jgi:CBS domain containing-hemolysin-like protein